MIDHAPQDVHFAMCTTSRQGTVTIPSLPLDNGETLIDVVVAFESWGTLSPVADNAILLCHALTGSAHAYDPAAPDDPRVGWWNPLIGPGRPFDTDRYCVICTNVVGGCYGSTGPASPRTPTIAGTVPSQNTNITSAPAPGEPVAAAVSANAHNQPQGSSPVMMPSNHIMRAGLRALRVRIWTSALLNAVAVERA